ncbi:hypothetical protein OAN22_02115 [Alphaproteobacteria bacterium]|nr:hypothetical protein [Alphaproteobacteria bacterium]
MSEKTFRKHLSHICTTHPNRRSFLLSKNPFAGKPFACYHDRVLHKTFYFTDVKRAHAVGKRLASDWGRGDVKIFNPKVRVASESIDIDNSKQYINPPKPPLNKTSHGDEGRISKKDFEKAESMVSIWKERTKGEISVPKLSDHFAQKLVLALKEHFDNSIDTWSNYCKSIGSSNFLLGKVSGFKAWLVWAIRADIVEKIKKGAYGVVDKFVVSFSSKSLFEKVDVENQINSLEESQKLKGHRQLN